MKIARKLEFVDDNEHFFHANCKAGSCITIELCNADIITGKISAVSHTELENTGYPESQILYRPYDEDHTFDPEIARLPREIYDKVYEAFNIPPKTQSISVIMVPGDCVTIYGRMTEKYVIIDDDGDEISIDEAIDKKIAKKMLEKSREII